MDTIIIRPKRGLFEIDFADIWRHRELLYVFGWRDVSVRYKQTIIGVLWVVIQPLVTTGVYAISFGKFAKVPTDGIPYPLFAFSGLLFWTLFASVVGRASGSLIGNMHIIQKVYFPRLIVPVSSALASLVDFSVTLIILFVMMAIYGFTPSLLGIILLPVLTLWTVLAALGIGFFFAAANAKYRDFGYLLPFALQIMIFLSPVIYSPRMFENYRWALWFNPMTGVIELLRYTLFGTGTIEWESVTISAAMSLLFLVAGFLYFQLREREAIDIL